MNTNVLFVDCVHCIKPKQTNYLAPHPFPPHSNFQTSTVNTFPALPTDPATQNSQKASTSDSYPYFRRSVSTPTKQNNLENVSHIIIMILTSSSSSSDSKGIGDCIEIVGKLAPRFERLCDLRSSSASMFVTVNSLPLAESCCVG